MSVLINLIVGIISKCIHISNQHIVHLKYYNFVNYTLIKAEIGYSLDFHFPTHVLFLALYIYRKNRHTQYLLICGCVTYRYCFELFQVLPPSIFKY